MIDQVDVLVIGAGLAGSSAALAAAEQNPRLRVALAAPSIYDGGCARETHALNAAVGPGDSWQAHYHDTMAGSGLIADPRLVRAMCIGAPEELEQLERAGVPFDTTMAGAHDLGSYGGSTRPRAVHRADLTGLDIMNTRVRQAITAGVVLLPGLSMLELIVHEGRCHGAVFFDAQTGRLRSIAAAACVLATGGGACVYPLSTISPDKAAAGIAVCLRLGLGCLDLEMVQFHPTGLATPSRPGHGALVEEEMRTLGATLHNALGERFMESYDPRGERATRDVVSRGCFTEITQGRGTPEGAVMLDISGVECSILERFPNSVRRLRAVGVDLTREKLIPTSPSAHFLMGGVSIDAHARTPLAGLCVSGEDAGGVHGGNRLGGNGITDALVFGRIAGVSASEDAARLGSGRRAFAKATLVASPAERQREIDARLRALMWAHGGLAREQEGLTSALAEVKAMQRELDADTVTLGDNSRPGAGLLAGRALADRLLLAAGILTSALERPASLAAHHRSDDRPEAPGATPYSVSVTLRERHLQTVRLPRPEVVLLPGDERLAA